ENRNRNTALVLIIAGLYLLLGNLIGFFTVTSIIITLFGIHKIRTGEHKLGYILLGIGLLFLTSGHLVLVLAIIMLSLRYFILRSKDLHKDQEHIQKQSILESLRWEKNPWELKNSSFWSLIGELKIDLSLAMTDQKETTL